MPPLVLSPRCDQGCRYPRGALGAGLCLATACAPPFHLQIVLGMILAVLASALSSLIAGSLVYVKSAHDECRRAAAALVLDSGAQLSR